MTQPNVQQINERVSVTGVFPGVGAWPTFADLSKVSFASQAGSIRTQEQLRHFVERNVGEIYSRTLPVVRNSEERAKEIVQELFPRLLNMLMANPEGIREPWAVIRVITRNLAIDGHRKSGRYQNSVRMLREAARHKRVEDEIENQDAQEMLVKMVDEVLTTLEPRHGYIITSIFRDGLLAREIGEELGLSESRVSEIKWDALEKIRPHLRDRIERECRECFWSQGIVDNDGHRSIRN